MGIEICYVSAEKVEPILSDLVYGGMLLIENKYDECRDGVMKYKCIMRTDYDRMLTIHSPRYTSTMKHQAS